MLTYVKPKKLPTLHHWILLAKTSLQLPAPHAMAFAQQSESLLFKYLTSAANSIKNVLQNTRLAWAIMGTWKVFQMNDHNRPTLSRELKIIFNRVKVPIAAEIIHKTKLI